MSRGLLFDSARKKTANDGRRSWRARQSSATFMSRSEGDPEVFMKVLVIDDDDIVRLVMVESLEEAGFDVVDLPSPIGATKTIVDNEIEAVAVDVLMPGMSGDKLSQLLRKNPRLADIGIVLVSSMEPTELERLREESGADEIVQKDDVRTLLPTALKRSVRFRRRSGGVVGAN